MRSIISYCLVIGMQGYQLAEDFLQFNNKFVFTHDMVLEIIVNTIVIILASVGLFKVAFIGKIVIQPDQQTLNYSKKDLSDFKTAANSTYNMNTTAINFTNYQVTYGYLWSFTEYFTVTMLFVAIAIILLFMLYSIPMLKKLIFKDKIVIPKYLFKKDNGEFKDMTIDYLWKPFLDNIFLKDQLLNFSQKCNDKVVDNFYYGKLNDQDRDYISKFNYTAKRRLEDIKKKMRNEEKEADNENVTLNSNYLNYHVFTLEPNFCDVLMKKWIQKYLEGIDIYWDGDVVGKRKAIYYFGRVSIFLFIMFVVNYKRNSFQSANDI